MDSITFLESYLADREIFVHCIGVRSFKFLETSGYSKGSILGPLVFMIFINDLNLLWMCLFLLYVDVDVGFILRNSSYLSETSSLFLIFATLVRSNSEYECI